jgi:5-methylcytosine-specific restriction endonuclease McrA
VIDGGPAQRLREFLETLYVDSHSSYLAKMDEDLVAEGNLSSLFYRSQINYLFRRFVRTAQYFQRQFPPSEFGDSRYRTEFRDFLRDSTRYHDNVIQRIAHHCHDCVLATEEDISAGTRNELRRVGRNRERKCYICGGAVDYRRNNNVDEGWSIDHVWPQSLGGQSSSPNLRIACRECNSNLKGDTIDDSDFHYEHFSKQSASFADYFERERDKELEAAVYAKTDYRCAVCKRSAAQVGSLRIARIEPSDSWHFLNLAPFCVVHLPEIDQ